MNEMAIWALNNGDDTSYTYGQNPNNPFTWDGNRILGCLCDEGYSGYDCSLRTCPIGDDPGTYDDHTEVQLLQCVANGGSFTLKFRRYTTPPIPVNTTAAQLQAILQSLPSLGPLTVTFSLDGLPINGTLNFVKPGLTMPQGAPPWGRFTIQSVHNAATEVFVAVPQKNTTYVPPTVACTPAGTQIIIINFDTIHGNLPPLVANNFYLTNNVNGLNGGLGTGTVAVFADGQGVRGFTSVTGTTELAVCNNRGVCDTTAGVCKCFPQWSSSDGQGGPGFLNDCGYRNDEF